MTDRQPMRVATYARVSTAEQVETGTSLADQERRLQAAVLSRGAELIESFVDAGVSGAARSRPALDALLERVEAREVDAVFATKIDRVSRSAVGLLSLLEHLHDHGCALVLIDEGLDTSTAAGALTSSLLGVIGGFERRRIMERTVQGRRAAAANEGRFVGSTPPFGYKAVPRADGRGKQLAIDEDQARTIRAMYRGLVRDRLTPRQVAGQLNDADMRPAKASRWDAETLRRWALRRTSLQAASGTWVFDGIEVSIPPILSPEESARWSDWQEERKKVPQKARGPYLLSGLLRMPCGKGAMGRTAGTQRPTYSCRNHYLPKGNPSRHDGCRNVPVDVIDKAVTSNVVSLLLSPDLLQSAASEHLGVQSDLHAELVDVEARFRDLDARVAEEMAALREVGFRAAAIAESLRPLRAEQDVLERTARSLRRRMAARLRAHSGDQLQATIDALRAGYGEGSPPQWRRALEFLDVVAYIDGYAPCEVCNGTGYLPFAPNSRRGRPRRCAACLSGICPQLRIEVDDATAAVVSVELSQIA